MIEGNPFTTPTFVKCWTKHFLPDGRTQDFSFAKNLTFYRSKLQGLYVNVGRNITKGVDLELGKPSLQEKGKCFLVYDVIDFDEQNTINFIDCLWLGHYSVKQYPGYLIALNRFKSLDDYLAKTFSKNSRYKLRKFKKRLEDSFNISFKAHCGEISKDTYDSIFLSFRHLLEKRFTEKQISNNNLDKGEWGFYQDVAYPMILEKKAILYVLYNNGRPISITLAYLSDNRIFDAITVFDTDFSKFHLGSIKIMYLVEWCIKNNWNILDFSKGHFDYKVRWANKKFDFHYHIWFDKRSTRATLIAYGLKQFFRLKQFLREKKVNEHLHRLTYSLKHKKPDDITYSFTDWNDQWDTTGMERIDIDTPEHSYLKGMCYEFLYLHQGEHINNLKVFKAEKAEDFFLLWGAQMKVGLQLNK
ncbi:GNAT family N-acetyltransferase [Flagellimonas sp.]|uniref:GNAT family N-acetyltransferase n=1 Tax=Flagellimonas sp. TaxID=2058762 RepID=UPI003BAC57A5